MAARIQEPPAVQVSQARREDGTRRPRAISWAVSSARALSGQRIAARLSAADLITDRASGTIPQTLPEGSNANSLAGQAAVADWPAVGASFNHAWPNSALHSQLVTGPDGRHRQA